MERQDFRTGLGNKGVGHKLRSKQRGARIVAHPERGSGHPPRHEENKHAPAKVEQSKGALRPHDLTNDDGREANDIKLTDIARLVPKGCRKRKSNKGERKDFTERNLANGFAARYEETGDTLDRRVVSYVRARTFGRRFTFEDREEITNKVRLKLSKSWHLYLASEFPHPYLWRIVGNAVKDFVSKDFVSVLVIFKRGSRIDRIIGELTDRENLYYLSRCSESSGKMFAGWIREKRVKEFRKHPMVERFERLDWGPLTIEPRVIGDMAPHDSMAKEIARMDLEAIRDSLRDTINAPADAFDLVVLKGYDIATAAGELRCVPTTVRNRVRRFLRVAAEQFPEYKSELDSISRRLNCQMFIPFPLVG